MNVGFQRTVDQIRQDAASQAQKGALFERLMKQYFREDPLYTDQFSDVWLWSEWAIDRPGFSGHDTGVDLVADEHEGGCCAIQCKFHEPGTGSRRVLSIRSSPHRRGIRSRGAGL